jgi:hypothetical protein
MVLEPVLRYQFGSHMVERAAKDLINGPLGSVFRDDKWRLTPAKGSKEFQNRTLYSNQTFFSHSLNVTITAAILFCEENRASLENENQVLPGSRYYIEDVVRVLMAAAAFHDFNKLVGGEYPNVLESETDTLVSLLDGFIRKNELLSDVKYLILTTEGGTSGYAASLKTELPGNILAKLQTYIEAGDRLSGYHGYANAKSYSDQLAALKDNSPVLSRIRTIVLVPRVQLLLVWKLRQAIMQYLPTLGYRVLHEGSDFISYVGEDLTEEDYYELDKKILQEIASNLPIDIIRQYPPSHNSIKWTWAERIEISPQNILEFIYCWGGRLLLWEGTWFNDHADLLVSSGIPFKILDGRPRIESPEDLRGAVDATRYPIVAAIVCSLAVDRGLDPEYDANDYIINLKWPIEELTGIPRKTAIALAWSAWVMSDILKASERIDEIINNLSIKLDKEIEKQENPLIGFTTATIVSRRYEALRTEKPVDKKRTCYQCLGEGKYPLDATRVNGYGAQNATGLKLTKLSDNAKGYLCPWCVAENQLRGKEFNNEKGLIAIHVHMADLVPDVGHEDIGPLLPTADDVQIGVGAVKGEIRLYPRGRFVKLDGHMTIFSEVSRSDKTEEGRFLKNLYNLVYQIGMKVHATSFMSNALPPIQMLSWDNAPAWAKNLSLDQANIDEVARKKRILESLIKMGQAQEGSDGFGNFVISFNRSPQHLYFVVNRCFYEKKPLGIYLESEEGGKLISLLEEEYMDAEKTDMMQRLGILGVEIAPSPNWSANDHRWVMQEAIRALESSRSLPREERISFVAAQIAAYAQRFQKYSSTTVIDDKSREFTTLLVDYLDKYHRGDVPTGIMRSYLVNHYAYEYRRSYRTVRPKDEEKKEVA